MYAFTMEYFDKENRIVVAALHKLFLYGRSKPSKPSKSKSTKSASEAGNNGSRVKYNGNSIGWIIRKELGLDAFKCHIE